MRPRAKVALAGSGVVVAAAAIAAVVAALSGGREEIPFPTTTVTTGAWVPAPPGSVPLLPSWGHLAGAPPAFAVPVGGSAQLMRLDGQQRVRLLRTDGTVAAVGVRDQDGVVRTVRYFDAQGRLSLVVSRMDALPAQPVRVGAARAAVCHDLRSLSGQRWGHFPIRWRLRLGSIPRGVSRPGVLRVARTARLVWTRNLNRCGVPDRSRASFAYMGSTTRAFGRNGVNTVEFGEVDRLGGACVGAIACTFTWGTATRATESDIRVDVNPRRPYALGPSVGRRIDLLSVLVHETGHTLGLNHVQDASNVMFPFVRVGTSTGRRLGLGDARANNALY